MKRVECASHHAWPGTHWRVLAGAAVAVVFVSLCLGLGHLPLLQPDEGRNAEVAREMKESGAWLVPTYNGVDYLDKPAFYFKAVALSLAVFGDNETAARLPSSLFGVALLAMVVTFCRHVYRSQRVAWIAMVVVATMPLYFVHARVVIFDMVLAFFVCAAIFAGYLAEEAEGRARRNWYLAGAAAAGAATLVKGPVGFVVPILVHLVSERSCGRRGVWKRLFVPVNFLVFFAVTLPWFIGLCVAKRDFFYYGIVDETFKRFTSAERFHRSQPFYFFPAMVALTFFPWSLLLPEAAVAAWRSRQGRHRADILCIVWSGMVVVFFSTSQSKLAGYILSVAVACGILIARLIDAALTNPAGRAAGLIRRATMAFVALCLAGAMVVAYASSHVDLLAKVTRLSVAEAQGWQSLAWPVGMLFGGFFALGTLALWRRSVWLSFVGLALTCPLCLVVNPTGVDLALKDKSARAVAEAMPPLPPETEVAALECFPNGLPFYLRRSLTLISKGGHELTSNYIPYHLAHSADWPSNIVRVAEFDKWMETRRRGVFLIAHARNIDRLEAIAATRGASVRPLTKRYCASLLPAPGAP